MKKICINDEIYIKIKYMFQPICPYNRYLNEKQKLMMEELGYKGLEPCLKEKCHYFKKLNKSRSAYQGGNEPVYGLMCWKEEICAVEDD